jgi:hypothetical protein
MITEAEMAVNILNRSDSTISVSINQWGKDGNTGVFEIRPGGEEPWDRSDPRGFVMYMTSQRQSAAYYVRAGDRIVVWNTSVEANGRKISPAWSGQP